MADKKISELDAITGAATAADDYFIVVDSSGAATKKISREELNNAIEQDVLSVVDINGGTIDGTTIGGSSAAAGTFTSLTANGYFIGTDPSYLYQSATDTITLRVGADGPYMTLGKDLGSSVLGVGSASGALAFLAGSTERMRLTNSGSLGLGTSAPAQELHLVGKARIQRSTNANLEITSDNNTGASPFVIGTNSDTFFLKNQAASGFGTGGNFIQYTESGSLQLMGTNYIDSSGNVGIGSTPSYRLHISNGSSTGTAMQLQTTGSGHNFDMVDGTGTARFRNVNGEMRLYGDLNSGGNGNIVFLPQGTTERMRIDSSGNVGIGNTAPSYLLDLYRSASTVARIRNSAATGGTPSATHGEFLIESTDANMGMQFLGSTTADQRILFSDTAANSGQIVYNHTSNYMALSTNGAERLRIDSNGDVAIGTTAPSAYGGKVVIAGVAAGGENTLVIANNSTNQFFRAGINNNVAQVAWDDGDDLAFGTATSSLTSGLTNEYMRIDSSGNVGIGTSSPATELDMSEGTLRTKYVQGGYGNINGNFHVDAKTGTAGIFYMNWFAGSGGVSVGNGASGYGTIRASAFTVSSDRRLKENISYFDSGLDKILQLKPATFDFINGENNQKGFIAQDVETVIPEVVGTTTMPDSDGIVNESDTYLTINSSAMIPYLVAAIQEQQASIEALEARIAALETA